MDLLLPRVREPELILPSYVKLDMALGAGSGSTLFDRSRYHSHGAISGASWATGLHGKCLDFDAATPDYVEIPASHTQLDFTSEDFSMVVRLKPDVVNSDHHIFIRGLRGGDGWVFEFGSLGNIYVFTNQSGAEQYTYSPVAFAVVDTWVTAGFSRSGETVTIYKNGVDNTQVHATHIDPASSSRSAKVGVSDNKVGYPFDGKIEFLRIFGGIALSASEHLAYHNALA